MNKKIVIAIVAVLTAMSLNGCTPTANPTILENEIYFAGAEQSFYSSNRYCYTFYFNYYYTESQNLDSRNTYLYIEKSPDFSVTYAYNGKYIDSYPNSSFIIIPRSILTAECLLIDTEDTDMYNHKIDMDIIFHVQLKRVINRYNSSQYDTIILKSKDFKVRNLMKDLRFSY